MAFQKINNKRQCTILFCLPIDYTIVFSQRMAQSVYLEIAIVFCLQNLKYTMKIVHISQFAFLILQYSKE